LETIDRYYWDTVIRKVVIHRIDAIAYGLIMAWVHHFYPKFWKKISLALLFIGLIMFWAIDHFRQPVTTAYSQVWIFCLSSLTYAFCLPFLSNWKTAPKWLMLPIQHISLVSYSLYLVHLGLISEVIQKWCPPTTGKMAILVFIGYFGLSILLSTLLYYVWEKPMMNLRERF
jgi:peptidoglycan/LPS O-acetylase OafA/YrhL